MARGRPVMLVGGAGTGKTVLMNDKLSALSEDWLVANVPFNFYTNSEMLQVTIIIHVFLTPKLKKSVQIIT